MQGPVSVRRTLMSPLPNLSTQAATSAASNSHPEGLHRF